MMTVVELRVEAKSGEVPFKWLEQLLMEAGPVHQVVAELGRNGEQWRADVSVKVILNHQGASK